MKHRPALALLSIVILPAAARASAQEPARPERPAFECGFLPPSVYRDEIRRSVRLGEIPDPRTKAIPAVAPRSRGVLSVGVPCISTAHIHPYEDTNSLLLTSFSVGELLNLMTDAANDLMSVHGDEFDFIGFWINFPPDHTVGTAFYLPIENDVMGIGDASTAGTPIFNDRPTLGLAGNNVEGYVMMWNVNSGFWQPGSGPSADFTRLVLGQEFEHRFALFLPNLLDGRGMQPTTGGCGRTFHWNWRVDGQGSGMEISEWVGSSPAVPNTNLNFNTDIGGVYSYPDLYLMGYVSAAEMDAFASELRFMDTSDCSSNYNGPISTFTSADIVAAAGPRVPDSTTSQKHWRTGWVMIHLPGDPPDNAELTKAVGILQQHMVDWNVGTLGRGTMDDTLFDQCNTVTAYGCGVNPTGSLTVLGGTPELGRSITYGVDNPLGTQGSGLAILSFSLLADAGFPCGTPVANFGMGGGAGELLIDLSGANRIARLSAGWTGTGNPAAFPITIPADVGLLGESFYAQGVILDPGVTFGVKFGLTEALQTVIGP